MTGSRWRFTMAALGLTVVAGVYWWSQEAVGETQGAAKTLPYEESEQAATSVKPYFRKAGTAPAVWGPGDLYSLLVTGEESNGGSFQFEALVPQGGGPPPHIHRNEDESFYVVKGSFEIMLGDTIVSAGPGDFVYIPRGTKHRFKNTGADTAIQLITFVPAGLDGWFKEVFHRVEDRNAVAPPITDEMIQRMVEAGPRYGIEILPEPDRAGR